MHAQRIIQDLLSTECPSIHAKRRACLAATVEAGSKGSLSLMGISRALRNTTAIRHRIKRCDRLLGNSKIDKEKHLIYGAMTRRIMCGIAQPLIIVDWSDLHADRSQRLLRAALVVQGRALTLYEEVHPMSRAASLKAHHAFLKSLERISCECTGRVRAVRRPAKRDAAQGLASPCRYAGGRHVALRRAPRIPRFTLAFDRFPGLRDPYTHTNSALKAILPCECRPIFITDAGFRSTWFKLLDAAAAALLPVQTDRKRLVAVVQASPTNDGDGLQPLVNAAGECLQGA